MNEPSGLLIFGLMFVSVMAFVGLVALVGTLADRSAAPQGQRQLRRPDVRRVRVVRSPGANGVQERSPHPNAKKPERSTVQPFNERSNVQPVTPMISSDLPTTKEELQQLAHIIVLYAKRSNKEIAIRDVTEKTKGEGPEYQRWSDLFDAALPATGEARRAARAKARTENEPEKEMAA